MSTMDFVKREDQNLIEEDQYKAYLDSIQKTHQMESDYQHTAMSMEQLHQLQTSLSATTIVHNFQLPLSPRQMSTLMFKTNHLARNFNEIPAHLPRNLTDIDLQLAHELPQGCRPEDLVLTQNLGRNLDLARNLSMDLELQNTLAQSLAMHNITEQDLARNLSNDLSRINEVLPQNLSHDLELTQHLNRQNLEQEILNQERRPMVVNVADNLVEQNLNRIDHLGQRLDQNIGQNLGQRLVNSTMNLNDPQRPIQQNDHLIPMPFHIKSEQEDDGYFYENINQSLNVDAINGHIPVATEHQPQTTLHAESMYVYAHNTPNINSLTSPELYSRPQNYVQNYISRENPQNLVVPRQYDSSSPYPDEFKKFRQDGVEENSGKIKEQRKENLKPSDQNKIFFTEFNGQNYPNASVEKDDSNDDKLTITEDSSMIKGEYICYKCNEVFPTKRGLKQHAKACTENGENDGEKQGKFSCSQCAYRCQSPAILKIHERVHSGEKPFSCTFCSYKSGQKNNVAKHMLVHMNQKPFRCQYCDYRCAQKNNLVVHERTHTGFKPFACPYCDYRTVQKPNLVKHMYLHTDQKPFSCDQCSYRCVQKTNLTKHKQRHLNERDGEKVDVKNQTKPYRPRQKSVKCPHCAYKCVQKSSLEKHMQFKHTDQSALLDNFEQCELNDENVGTVQNLSVKKDDVFDQIEVKDVQQGVPVHVQS